MTATDGENHSDKSIRRQALRHLAALVDADMDFDDVVPGAADEWPLPESVRRAA
jgi:hypothetical protein